MCYSNSWPTRGADARSLTNGLSNFTIACLRREPGGLMSTRREFLTSLFGAGAVGLIAACGGVAQAPSGGTSAPVAPAGATAAPAQTAPAQAAAKPAGGGGTVTFALENDVNDFDPMLSRAFVDRNAHYPDLRLIGPRRYFEQNHPVACHEVGPLTRRKAGHVHAAPGCQVPRRHAVRRRFRQVEHRPLPHDERLSASRRRWGRKSRTR